MKPYFEEDGCTLYLGDCRDILPGIHHADLLVTDPPYQLALASNGKSSGWGDLMNSAMFLAWVVGQAKRITHGSQGAAWVFCNWRGEPIVMKAAYEAGWPINSMLIWDKEWIGPGGTQGLRPSYEMIALFCQPAFAIPDRGLPDIWRVQASSKKPTGHPAEKPLPLFQRLIRETGARTVVDPFVGSGTALVAARSLGANAVGIEVEERYAEMAAKRLQQRELIGG